MMAKARSENKRQRYPECSSVIVAICLTILERRIVSIYIYLIFIASKKVEPALSRMHIQSSSLWVTILLYGMNIIEYLSKLWKKSVQKKELI